MDRRHARPLAGQVLGPGIHELAPPVEQVASLIGALDTDHDVRQCRFGDGSGGVGTFGGPRAKVRAVAVRRARNTVFAAELGHRGVGDGPPGWRREAHQLHAAQADVVAPAVDGEALHPLLAAAARHAPEQRCAVAVQARLADALDLQCRQSGHGLPHVLPYADFGTLRWFAPRFATRRVCDCRRQRKTAQDLDTEISPFGSNDYGVKRDGQQSLKTGVSISFQAPNHSLRQPGSGWLHSLDHSARVPIVRPASDRSAARLASSKR